MRTCSFCKKDIEDGTGKMYVKKNMIKLGRVPRKVKWVKE